MYTILIVDDEPIVLDTLKNAISWNELGIDQIYTATDGNMALELIESNTIHIVITDIQMPNLDGIQLLKRIRTISPYSRLVLLSAFSDFEYAKEAILLGVENYILKPIQIEEVEATIKKAIDNIKSKKGISELLFKENIIHRWVHGDIDSSELVERTSILDINIYSSSFTVICIKKKTTSASLALYCSKCIDDLNQLYDTYYYLDDNSIFVIIVAGNDINIEQISDLLNNNLNNLQYDDKIVISIGHLVNNRDLVANSYKSAYDLLNANNLYDSKSILISDKDTPDMCSFITLDIIGFLILECNLQQRKKEAMMVFNRLIKNKPITLELSNDLIINASLALIGGLNRNFTLSTDLSKCIVEKRITFIKPPSLETLSQIFIELIEYGHQLYCDMYEKLSPIIKLFIRYIKENYGKGVSIKEFCANNSISTSYLGFLFKEETGKYFNEFLLEYRMNQSKLMLELTSMKINTIAEKVGFCSPSYYVVCFKKYTGYSPAQYRMLLHENNASY